MDAALKYEIRPLRRRDAPAWRTLRLEMLKDSPAAFLMSYEDALARDAAAWAGSIAEEGVEVIFGLFFEGALGGSAGFYVHKGAKVAHKGTMWGVYVSPAWRRLGLGEALVRRVIEHARAHVAVLLSGAITTNARSRALYGKLGFEPYGMERDALRVDGASHDEELLAIHFEPGP